MHHRLHPSSNRLETGQPQQGEGCCSQRCYFTSTIAVVAVGVFVELGVTNTVPTCPPTMKLAGRRQARWPVG